MSSTPTDARARWSSPAGKRPVPMQPPFDDRQDFDDARRGFLGTLSPLVIRNTDGRVVWDMESFGFLDGECPDTVLSGDQLLDLVALNIDGPRAATPTAWC